MASVAQSLRESIIKAAAELFARQGIQATNIREIASQASISSGTLHYHFPSKSELVESVIVESVSHLNTRTREILDMILHPREQLTAIAKLFFVAFDRNWDRYYVALLLGDELRAIRPNHFPTTSDLFVELARRGQKQRHVRSGDPVMLGILCHGILLRTARGRAFGEVKRPLLPRADEVSKACRLVIQK